MTILNDFNNLIININKEFDKISSLSNNYNKNLLNKEYLEYSVTDLFIKINNIVSDNKNLINSELSKITDTYNKNHNLLKDIKNRLQKELEQILTYNGSSPINFLLILLNKIN